MLTPPPNSAINHRPFRGNLMSDKRTMTLNLSSQEMDLVERLADEKGLSKTALVRQALRLYQSISARLDKGEKVFVEDPTTKDKAELMVLS